jgi:hypothetical protein
MPTIKMTLAEVAAKAQPFTAAQRVRFAAQEKDDALIDFSDLEEITPAKIATGHYVVAGRGGARTGAGRKALGKSRKTVKLSPAAIRRFESYARRHKLRHFSDALEAASRLI